mmetsp:Transcript_40604/g.115730  ORF Transcript_40604/g.115730 Transcript_40604/m.115730 type:complete len:146 (-) Transcript_40604:2236-2673(-)
MFACRPLDAKQLPPLDTAPPGRHVTSRQHLSQQLHIKDGWMDVFRHPTAICGLTCETCIVYHDGSTTSEQATQGCKMMIAGSIVHTLDWKQTWLAHLLTINFLATRGRLSSLPLCLPVCRCDGSEFLLVAIIAAFLGFRFPGAPH